MCCPYRILPTSIPSEAFIRPLVSAKPMQRLKSKLQHDRRLSVTIPSSRVHAGVRGTL